MYVGRRRPSPRIAAAAIFGVVPPPSLPFAPPAARPTETEGSTGPPDRGRRGGGTRTRTRMSLQRENGRGGERRGFPPRARPSDASPLGATLRPAPLPFHGTSAFSRSHPDAGVRFGREGTGSVEAWRGRQLSPSLFPPCHEGTTQSRGGGGLPGLGDVVYGPVEEDDAHRLQEKAGHKLVGALRGGPGVSPRTRPTCPSRTATVAEALAALNLGPSRRSYLHVRSPRLKAWNAATGELEWRRRDDDEMNVTSFLPAGCHLKARGSDPARTWSSQIYADLAGGDDDDDGTGEGGGERGGGDAAVASRAGVARSARQWALSEIRRHASDPKGSDDAHGGGEWFLAYLRAAHREIYDDVDRSDPSGLLARKWAAGEGDGRPRKHKIGDIAVHDCARGFEDLVGKLGGEGAKEGGDDVNPPTSLEEWTRREKRVTEPAEVMAKILIDIWMSKLVDFSAATGRSSNEGVQIPLRRSG